MADLPEIYAGGEIRKLGHNPEKIEPRLLMGVRAIEKMPRSEWREFDPRPANHPIKILDQNGKGACNGHAAVTSLEWTRLYAGMTHVDLSPWMPYAIMCQGVDRGSMIDDALSLLMKTGTCRFENVPYATINPRKLTKANYDEAANFKIEIGEMLPDFDSLMTAVQLIRTFNYSICVGNNFDPDGNGVVGYSRGPGNHAVAGGMAGAVKISGQWHFRWPNSWHTRWGLMGWALTGQKHIDDQPYFQAYTTISANDLAGDERNPPKAA